MSDMDMSARMLAGELYRAEGPLLAELQRAQRLFGRYNTTGPDDEGMREQLLGELLGSVGDGVTIRPPFYCDYGSHISIGSGTFVNFNAVMLDCAHIRIGADCQIASNVQLLTATHPVDPTVRRALWEYALPITIGDNVWLGGGVIVCPGVSIGEDTVVGAGAVVTKDLPAGVVAVGNPARVLREIGEQDRVSAPQG